MILELTQSELETLQLALSITKSTLRITHKVENTPTIDEIAAKVNTALADLQKDIQFEKYRES